MAVRVKGSKFYIAFRWKNNRMDAVCSATSKKEALRTEKAVRNAFAINRFDHLDPAALEVVMKIFQNKGWKLPTDLADLDPQRELTLYRAVEDYVNASERNRTERKKYAIDHLLDYFGENTPLHGIKVSDIRKYRNHRLNAGVSNGTINIEISALSGIFREQVDQEVLEFNPCSRVKKLPGKQLDIYVSYKDFQKVLGVSGWLRPIITMLFFTGMRPSEVYDLQWNEVDFSRKMIILPPSRTKEGKNENQKVLRDKRIPMHSEVYDLLCSLKHRDGNVVQIGGRVFTHKGRRITGSTKRKCWKRICKHVGLGRADLRCWRHTFKSNAAHSGMDQAIRDAIMGHATHLPVADLYIHIPDEKLVAAVNSMTFDHGETHVDYSGGEKSDAKMTPKSAKKEKRQVAV